MALVARETAIFDGRRLQAAVGGAMIVALLFFVAASAGGVQLKLGMQKQKAAATLERKFDA